MFINKAKKFIKSPEVFFRDYLLKRKPIIRNEVLCPVEEEGIVLKHDLTMDGLLDTSLEIDVVYTWVDDSDTKWMNKLESYRSNRNKGMPHGKDYARFSNHNELYYSVSSVLKNMPWVRNIYIVTDNQEPSWLNVLGSDKITIVDHCDIIDKEYLPTFNSHVIEAHLHKISSLSENFIYFNDDVFVGRYLPASHFFCGNGIAALFLSHKKISKMLINGTNTPTLYASLNSIGILSRLNFNVDIPLVHSYVPLKKSCYQYVWDNYGCEIESFLSNRFRADNDYNMATFLVPWMMYHQGVSVPKRDICYYFNIRSKQAKVYYKELNKARNSNTMPHSFCANDFLSEYSNNITDYESMLKYELDRLIF